MSSGEANATSVQTLEIRFVGRKKKTQFSGKLCHTPPLLYQQKGNPLQTVDRGLHSRHITWTWSRLGGQGSTGNSTAFVTVIFTIKYALAVILYNAFILKSNFSTWQCYFR